MISTGVRIWRARWNLLRLLVAAFLLWTALADTGARLARRQLAALPGFDFTAEVVKLRGEGRFGEALVIADAGLASTTDPADKAEHDRIAAEKLATEEAQSSWFRRAKDLARGALTGGTSLAPPGSKEGTADASLEMFVGAIAADLFIVGDIRDLAIQGYKYARDGEADGVIVALSGIGLATTLAPEIDWAPSILKTARRIGAMGDKLGEWIIKAFRGRQLKQIDALLTDTASMARTASPAGAVRLLKTVEGPEDAARLARFLSREGRTGAAALHVTGEAGAVALRQADTLRAAGKIEEAARLESLVMKAAAKGDRGAALLKGGALRALARPHPLVGLLKGVYKGNVSALVQRILERLDPVGWWVIPLLAGWTVLEGLMLMRKMTKKAATT